jgi:hypothetical protein
MSGLDIAPNRLDIWKSRRCDRSPENNCAPQIESLESFEQDSDLVLLISLPPKNPFSYAKEPVIPAIIEYGVDSSLFLTESERWKEILSFTLVGSALGSEVRF